MINTPSLCELLLCFVGLRNGFLSYSIAQNLGHVIRSNTSEYKQLFLDYIYYSRHMENYVPIWIPCGL